MGVGVVVVVVVWLLLCGCRCVWLSLCVGCRCCCVGCRCCCVGSHCVGTVITLTTTFTEFKPSIPCLLAQHVLGTRTHTLTHNPPPPSHHRYERQAQSQSMEQDLATQALEAEHKRQDVILHTRKLLKAEQSKAAVTLQAKLRGNKQRKKHRVVVQQRTQSAVLLQSLWRVQQSKQQLDVMKVTIISFGHDYF